ncbi:MAG: hypothetical protein IJK77_07510 [Lachnospiraceae bacterium]|nr:hypothetical protein [Lachnospiraceae bacterium]
MPNSRSKYSEAAVARRKSMVRDIVLGVLIGLAVIFVVMVGRFIYEKGKNPDYRLADLFGITTEGTLPTLPTLPINDLTLPSSSETLPETDSSEETAEMSTEETADSTTEADTEDTATETTAEPDTASDTTEPASESETVKESAEATTEESKAPTEATPEETTPQESSSEEGTTPEETTEEETTEEATTEPWEVLTDPSDINYHLTRYNMDEKDLGDCRQLIAVQSSGTQCMLYFFDKGEKEWALSNAIPSAPGVLGENGVTTSKQEGDGCTPAGFYALGPCYGEEESSPTAMEYHQIVEGDYWVDDAASKFYNTFVHEAVFEERFGWETGEDLFASLRYYRYMVVIGYNTDPVVPGAGSAIFLRCQADDETTSGSVGTKEATVFAIMRWLDPETDPHILIY